MKSFVEKRRPTADRRLEIETRREELDRLRRRVRELTERCHSAFDAGFAAATRMVESGADAERLRVASGVVQFDDLEDTDIGFDVSFMDDTDVEVKPPAPG